MFKDQVKGPSGAFVSYCNVSWGFFLWKINDTGNIQNTELND